MFVKIEVLGWDVQSKIMCRKIRWALKSKRDLFSICQHGPDKFLVEKINNNEANYADTLQISVTIDTLKTRSSFIFSSYIISYKGKKSSLPKKVQFILIDSTYFVTPVFLLFTKPLQNLSNICLKKVLNAQNLFVQVKERFLVKKRKFLFLVKDYVS